MSLRRNECGPLSLKAVAGRIFCQALLAKFAAAWLGRTYVRLRQRGPIRAVAAPVPSVVALQSPVRHAGPLSLKRIEPSSIGPHVLPGILPTD